MNKITPTAIFLDLDGTTFDIQSRNGREISKANKKAIIELNKKVPVILSTGRSKKFVIPLQKEMGLKYSVAQNGSLIFDSKSKVVFEDVLPKETFKEVIKMSIERKLGLKLNDSEEFFGTPWFLRKILRSHGFKTHKGYDYKINSKNNKIVILSKSKQKLNSLKKSIQDKYPDIYVVSSAKGYSIEVTGRNSSKGLANNWVCKKLKVDPKKAVHFGDSMNDSTAIDYMKLIAMKNSSKELKKIATIVSKFNNKNAGLKKTFQEYLNI